MSCEITYPCKFDSTLQPAIFQAAVSPEPRPLVVALHTWSFDHTQFNEAYGKLCRKYDFHLIHPKFRGPNWQRNACGSDLVVSDLEDAVAYMKKTVNVDEKRIYLVGGSGGGHCSLLMAGRRPDLWTAVSAWCPISDIAAWHKECKGGPCFRYAEHIESACGGDPATDEAAALDAKKRSPL
ncbi:MAG: prolyl oligopeptidase family serine peptidase, partial [Lentisphaeria bacterium]|nr:prolyl oligopeptidase family serine peptidase [Lentisphaeria bacterium]